MKNKFVKLGVGITWLGIKLLSAVAITVAIYTLPIMLLWNALLPVLFGAPAIGFWQTYGLALLIRLLVAPTSITTK